MMPDRGDIFEGKRDRYAIIKHAGDGGVGAVYQARTLSSGALVALKVMHGARFRVTEVARERWKQEIAATLAISHPHVVRGVDDGEREGEPFLVMEWMPGGTLQDQIGQGGYAPEQAIRWTAHMLKGLIAIHREGYVHRDIKPNNVLLTAEFVAKLADLGIAKKPDIAPALTLPGDQMGSLLYISPHQRREPDKATKGDDFYSLCCVLYELASGRRIHTSNPRLTYLRPPLFPVELCHLVDVGMAQTEPWEEVLGEMTLVINLNTDALDPAYDGGVLTPSRRISCMARELEDKYPRMVSSEAEPRDRLAHIVAAFRAGFDEAAREIVEQGIELSVDRSEEDSKEMLFNVGLMEPLAPRVERLGVLEAFLERAFGGIYFEEREGGYVFGDVWGKRIAVDVSEFVDEQLWERVFRDVDEGARCDLHRLGRAVALSIAVGAVERIDELAEPDDDSHGEAEDA